MFLYLSDDISKIYASAENTPQEPNSALPQRRKKKRRKKGHQHQQPLSKKEIAEKIITTAMRK